MTAAWGGCMVETVVWVLGGLASVLVLNRLLASWLISRAIRRSYSNDLRRVLYGKEHQVKGRFD